LRHALAQANGRIIALAPEEASMINGADLLVDGGYTTV